MSQNEKVAAEETIGIEILEELILLSHRLGDPSRDWVIPGEGCASIRLDDSMFAMTADGASLGSLKPSDLTLVSFSPLLDAVLGEGPLAAGEAEDLLLSARLDPNRPQPSGAAFLHAYLLTLPDVLLVGHTHSDSIAGLTCSSRGWELLQKGGRLTPDEVLHCGAAPCCVSFARPGIELARAVRDQVEAYLEARQVSPKTIYLQNQGFIALGGLAGEVERTTAVADKSARIMERALIAGAPSFLSRESVEGIAQGLDLREIAPEPAPAPVPPAPRAVEALEPVAESNEPAQEVIETTDRLPAAEAPATEPVQAEVEDKPEPDEEDIDAAIAYYKKRIEDHPKNARAHYNLGLALLAKGVLEESVDALCRAVILNPNDVDANVNLGVALAQKGAWNEAIAQLDAALALAPADPSIHYNLGFAHLSMGQAEEAITLFQEAARLDPSDPQTHLSLGEAFFIRGWADEAVAAFNECLRLDKDLPEAHYKLGRALARSDKRSKAIVHYQDALRLGMQTADLHAALGNAYCAERQFDTAIGEYQEALFLNPEHLEAYCGFGQVLYEKGAQSKSAEYWDTARDAFNRALTLSPNHAPSLTGLAALEVKAGNLEAAASALNAAIDADPAYQPAYDALAKLQRQMGKWRDAWRTKRSARPRNQKSAAR